jgi:hypothetical protein
MNKPLGHKAYGSIPHMPGSKRGPGDHGIEEKQASLITGKRPKNIRAIVQEKWDGCCMSVAKIDGRIVSLGRAGHLAQSAPYEHMQRFATWVREREYRFDRLLLEGERVVGEWMLMAHGLVYEVRDPDALFLAFDIMRGHERETADVVSRRCEAARVDSVPYVMHWHHPEGGICSPEEAVRGQRRDIAPADGAEPEGVVYRVEKLEGDRWRHLFCTKWVRGDFEPGIYLPEDGSVPTWNRCSWLEQRAA